MDFTATQIISTIIAGIFGLAGTLATGAFLWNRHSKSSNIQAFAEINKANGELIDRQRTIIQDRDAEIELINAIISGGQDGQPA